MARVRRRSLVIGAPLAMLIARTLTPASAFADDFYGFDPATFNGTMLSAQDLRAMVNAAAAVIKPRNGKSFVFGFANLQRNIAFCVKVEQGLKANCEAAGIRLLIADNRLDGATALANAESFLQREVDFVIEFQTDANFGATIMRQMKTADTRVIAIDIPMPGATFFGANNSRSGFMGGSYLAQAAIAKFGLAKVTAGYLVVGRPAAVWRHPGDAHRGSDRGFPRLPWMVFPRSMSSRSTPRTRSKRALPK